jgi:hypothetical protein
MLLYIQNICKCFSMSNMYIAYDVKFYNVQDVMVWLD